jgi:hypothetical protein
LDPKGQDELKQDVADQKDSSGDDSQPGIAGATTQTADTGCFKKPHASGDEATGQKSDQASKRRRNDQTAQQTELLADFQAFESDWVETTDQDEHKAVADQKKRAINLWNDVRRVIGVDAKVADVVAEKLGKGLVPPIFHAYCAVYRKMCVEENTEENARVSMEKIELLRPEIIDVRDEVNFESHPFAQIASIPASEQGSDTLLDEGLTNVYDEKNLGSHPSKDIAKIITGTRGSGILSDGEFIKEASFFDSDEMAQWKISDRDLGTSWVFSQDWTETVCQLLNADAEMVGADVEVTKVHSDFNMGNVKGTSATHLITRRLSRGVVAECLNMAPADTLAIVGNPGIGKSWTLIYALQQLLLRKGACVLFFMAKSATALACIRRDDALYVWEAGMTKAKSDLFDCENVWVLLDPEEATKQSTGFVTGQRRLLYAASNNKKHFANDVRKKNALALHYMSPFDDEELRAALPHMLPPSSRRNIEWIMVFHWAGKVGNLPRWLLTKAQFEGRLEDVDLAVTEMNPALVQKILNSDGLSEGQVNLPGTLFAVSAERVWNKDVGKPMEIGYDGEEGVIYTKPSLKLMNEDVFKKVVGANREAVLSYWGAISNSERSEMGEAVEDLVWQVLRYRCLFQTWSMSSRKFVQFRYPNLTNVSKTRTGCTMADLKGVFASGNELARMAPGTALIDFAGPGRRVYQATVSANHSMPLVGLQKLLEAAGYMEVQNGKYVMVDDSKLPNLDFYWIVPREKFGAWKDTKTVRDEQVGRALETYVDQFVLSLDVEPPSASNIAAFLGSHPDWTGGNVVLAGVIPTEDGDRCNTDTEKSWAKTKCQRRHYLLPHQRRKPWKGKACSCHLFTDSNCFLPMV